VIISLVDVEPPCRLYETVYILGLLIYFTLLLWMWLLLTSQLIVNPD